MPEPESPQVRRDRHTALGVFALVALALQTAGVLVTEHADGLTPTDEQRAECLALGAARRLREALFDQLERFGLGDAVHHRDLAHDLRVVGMEASQWGSEEP